MWKILKILGTVFLLSACAPERVPEPYQPSSAHDAYQHSLELAGLASSALGRGWASAAVRSIGAPDPISLPYRETLFVDPARPFASGLLFSASRGQRVTIDVKWEGREDAQLFVDLFRRAGEPGRPPIHVASADEGSRTLEFEPKRDNDYVLRVQPELLRGGRCTIAITFQAALLFPVSGHNPLSIQSRFGASREGGRRRHHGVDIFAQRHTPVLATSRAYVRRVQTTNIGGQVVWLRDAERGFSLYYAHLQTQKVAEGDFVEPGQPIGTVGNSGNARTTPPHLHFGIYARGEGPIDPQPFIDQQQSELPTLGVDTGLLGRWTRVRKEGTILRFGPQLRKKEALDGLAPVHVIGARGSYYRVALPDSTEGYLGAEALEDLTPLRKARLESVSIRSEPDAQAPTMAEIDSAIEVPVLAQFRSVLLVHTSEGRLGWIREE